MTTALDRSTDLINEIGNALVHDEAYLALPWDAIALVVGVDETSVRMHGYAYLDDGEITAETPESGDVSELFRELSAEMRRADGRGWKVMLIQIRRSTGKVTMLFENSDERRWAVTPDNYERMREELQPE
jgi:hypothetical protein